MILRFEHTTKVFRSSLTRRPIHTIGPITFGVELGEIFGYLGPNGAGKTTTIKMAVGLLKPTSGMISCFGKDVDSMEVRSRIGFLPEHPYFYQHLTALELLEFYGGIFGLSHHESKRRAWHLLELTGLTKAARRSISKFSKGMLQRIGLAQALINDPDLVILDEPLAGLDPVGRRQMRDLIMSLKHKGKTVFLSSHILQDVEMMCDRVAILWEGRVVEVANVEEVLSKTIKGIEICVEGGSPETLEVPISASVRAGHDGLVITCPPHIDVNRTVHDLISKGARIKWVSPQRQTLEDYFMAQVRGLGEVRDGETGEEALSRKVGIS